MTDIVYAVEPNLSAAEFQDVLIRSTLAERRPAGDLARLDAMLRQADIIVTAPAANDYYPHIGMQHMPRAWMFDREG